MSDDKNEKIKSRAYQIWEEEGRPHGRHDEHWHRASKDVEYPGMMGDGTEEQNLDQPGDPAARITEAEVKQAFGSGGSAQSGKSKG